MSKVTTHQWWHVAALLETLCMGVSGYSQHHVPVWLHTFLLMCVNVTLNDKTLLWWWRKKTTYWREFPLGLFIACGKSMLILQLHTTNLLVIVSFAHIGLKLYFCQFSVWTWFCWSESPDYWKITNGWVINLHRMPKGTFGSSVWC